jgi:hypothetical protein
MSRRWWTWCSLLGVAAWLALFGDKTPSAGAADAVVQPSARVASSVTAVMPRAAAASSPTLLALVPRESLWATEGANAPVSDLFAASGPAAATSAPAPAASAPAASAAPPTPPPLPFTYVGKRFDGKAWEVFLSQGEQTLIVHEGMVIDGQYRVESIKPPVLVLRYLPLSQQQNIAVGGAD